MYDIYHAYTNYTDLLFAALSGLPVAMQQSFALSRCFLIHLLCITQRENLICIMQLLAWTAAWWALHVGHIVACDYLSPSIERKSRNTRDRRNCWSPKRRNTSRPHRSLICSTRMSMHEWYKRVRLSDRHSSVFATVAAFEMEGIIPSRRHANALPPTVLSLLRLATVKQGKIYQLYFKQMSSI